MQSNRNHRRGWGGRQHGGPKLPAELRNEMGIEAGPSRNSSGSRPSARIRLDREEGRPGPTAKSGGGAQGDSARHEATGKRPLENLWQPGESSKSTLAPPPAKKNKTEPELRLPKPKTMDTEDQEIEWLEYMLRKEKGKGKAEIDADGLDDILDFAELIGPGGAGIDRDDDDSHDEGGIDLDSDEDGDEDEDSADSDEDGSELSAVDARPPRRNHSPTDGAANDTLADSRYIPPHLRAAALKAKDETNTARMEQRRKLERRMQGLLNKLSESNIESILGEVEGLYRDHSRHDTTETLTDLILTMISNRSNLLDSFVVLYATLVGALYRIVGVEFGAHFLTTLVKRYSSSKTSPTAPTTAPSLYETPDASKISLNLLTLIAELYNAQVVSAKLIYDLVIGFINTEQGDGAVMGEAETESLLKVIKGWSAETLLKTVCGGRLRADDPGSLNDIVNLVNERIKGREKEMTVRAGFMVETLVNLKSGKSKSTKNPGETDSVERMKKFLGGLGRKQRLLAHEPLNVSLADLHNEHSKGKWWLVGAAWAGNPLVEHHEKKLVEKKPAKKAGDDLLELARKQGMNTDVRRTIFVALMSSEDYVHACDRLSALRLTEVQQRECVRVALHCCGIESSYNPFYTLVLEQLASQSHNHRYTLQYALWDYIRDLEGNAEDSKAAKKAKTRGANIAKAVAYIIARETMDLTVLKAVEFTTVRKNTRAFFVTLLAYLILSTQTPSPLFALPLTFDVSTLNKSAIEDVFEKALVNPDVAQGLSYIIQRSAGGGKDAVGGLSGVPEEVVRRGLKIAQNTLARSA